MKRCSQVKAMALLAVSLFLLIKNCWMTSESDVFSGNEDKVDAMEGEIFLSGPDEQRIPFRVGRDEALEAINIISQGQPVWDGKHQGRAYFYIYYTDGIKDHIAVTTKIVRVNERPISVDMDRLLDLLQRIESGVQGLEN